MGAPLRRPAVLPSKLGQTSVDIHMYVRYLVVLCADRFIVFAASLLLLLLLLLLLYLHITSTRSCTACRIVPGAQNDTRTGLLLIPHSKQQTAVRVQQQQRREPEELVLCSTNTALSVNTTRFF